ncbi:MAG: hypothetical protein M0C28_06720 [Candidatus Moduliflexus flocculans]|nr:hypothetical protein [Candidatus Moduliflexus flocculans]
MTLQPTPATPPSAPPRPPAPSRTMTSCRRPRWRLPRWLPVKPEGDSGTTAFTFTVTRTRRSQRPPRARPMRSPAAARNPGRCRRLRRHPARRHGQLRRRRGRARPSPSTSPATPRSNRTRASP